MIQLAFCDDDQSVLHEISVLLEQFRIEHGIEMNCSAFHSPLELVAKIEKGMRFDILILDVIMPDGNGIDIAKEIRRYDNNVKIIFFTSSSDFAVQSYSVDAYYYQLKPLEKESFLKLMDSVISECKEKQKHMLVIHNKKGVIQIDLEKLKYCEIRGRTLLFCMENGKILECGGSLEKVCGALVEYDNFLRPHRSYLVNMDHIQNIASRIITMDDSTEIFIPHGKIAEVKKLYFEYVFNRKRLFI